MEDTHVTLSIPKTTLLELQRRLALDEAILREYPHNAPQTEQERRKLEKLREEAHTNLAGIAGTLIFALRIADIDPYGPVTQPWQRTAEGKGTHA
jgi:hypothetical protein